jgi:hypothetical protein
MIDILLEDTNMTAGPLFYLLQGQNITEFEKFGKDKDPKHLAEVGRNLTILSINGAIKNDMAVAAAERDAQSRAEAAEREAREVIHAEARYQDDLRLAEDRSRSAKPKLNSDEGVDSFLDSI